MYYAKSTTLTPFNPHRPMKWVLSFPFPFLRLKNCLSTSEVAETGFEPGSASSDLCFGPVSAPVVPVLR